MDINIMEAQLNTLAQYALDNLPKNGQKCIVYTSKEGTIIAKNIDGMILCSTASKSERLKDIACWIGCRADKIAKGII